MTSAVNHLPSHRSIAKVADIRDVHSHVRKDRIGDQGVFGDKYPLELLREILLNGFINVYRLCFLGSSKHSPL